MTAKGFLRGHEIYWDGEQYRYVDSDSPTVGNRRACGYCGLPDTPEGHDPCIGELPGVMNACCGHGRTCEAYIQYRGGDCVRGRDALDEMTALDQEMGRQ